MSSIAWSNIKCLIFDLDDTLVDSTSAYEKALTSVGLSLDNSQYQQARKEIKSIIGEGHVSARNRLLYFKRIAELSGNFSASMVLDLMDKYEKDLEREISAQWKELNREVLLRKLGAHFQIGIISNENTRTQLLKLRAMDPQGEIFKNVCFSEDVGVEKPDAKIFEVFLKRANVRAKECCMIGDSISNDIEPSLKLGFNALLTNEFVQNNANTCGFPSIRKLDDLLGFIK